MISHQHKTIFIHLPKCAGTSIEHAFGHNIAYAGRSSQDHRSIREIQPLDFNILFNPSLENLNIIRRRYKQIAERKKYQGNPNNLLKVNKDEYVNYFKFTIVRNPYARAYSWYHNVIRDPFHRNQLLINEDILFEKFLAKFLSKKRLMQPYLYFLKEFNGNIPMDYIGKFENLNEDFTTVCAKLGVTLELPHKNNRTEKSRDYRSLYTEESYRLVTDYYKDDLHYFDYSFDDLK